MSTMELVHKEIEQDIQPLLSNAKSIAEGVQSQEGYDVAGAYLLRLKDIRKRLTEALEPFVKAAHEAWKMARKRADSYYDPVDQAESIVKPAMAAWWEEEERKRLLAQQEAELAAKKAEEDRILQEAEHAEQAGERGAAQAILETPVSVPPVILPGASQVKGVSMRELWSFEIVDFKALVQAVARGEVSIAALQPNREFLGQQARSLKGELKYPGVRVFSVKSVAAGRA
jgi:hypothetical protein